MQMQFTYSYRRDANDTEFYSYPNANVKENYMIILFHQDSINYGSSCHSTLKISLKSCCHIRGENFQLCALYTGNL